MRALPNSVTQPPPEKVPTDTEEHICHLRNVSGGEADIHMGVNVQSCTRIPRSLQSVGASVRSEHLCPSLPGGLSMEDSGA